MAKLSASRLALPLPVEDILRRVGQHLRVARMRRNISVRSMAERMMVSPMSVVRLEAGDPSVSLGILLSALWVLQLHHRFSAVADPDTDAMGKSLDIARLPKRIRRKAKP
ncbi:MAG: hypothetical protein ACHQF3_08065 [Alphaproteobacteria bacterium]